MQDKPCRSIILFLIMSSSMSPSWIQWYIHIRRQFPIHSPKKERRGIWCILWVQVSLLIWCSKSTSWSDHNSSKWNHLCHRAIPPYHTYNHHNGMRIHLYVCSLVCLGSCFGSCNLPSIHVPPLRSQGVGRLQVFYSSKKKILITTSSGMFRGYET